MAWQPRGRVLRWANALMARRHGRSLFGFDVLLLTTVGRRSGVERTNPVSWFAEPAGDGWLVVASANGPPPTRPGTTTWSRAPTSSASRWRAVRSR